MLALSASALAANAKWETMSFTDDISAGIEALNKYCLTHDVKLEDVLWANQTEESALKSGMTILLPKNQADMLAIWQHSGAWKPTALVPVTSEAAAKRAMNSGKSEPEAKPAPISLTAIAKTEAAAKPAETPAPAVKASSAAEAPAPAKKQQASPSQAIAQMTNEKPEIQAASDSAKKAQPQTQPVKITNIPQNQKAKSSAKKQQASPAKVIAQTAKPDKILTAKKKSPQQEIPGLMDPIIILSPNGDPTNGPMRLIISGDKVEVVKLPQNAVPKKPSIADASEPFTSSYSYLPYYNLTGKQRSNILTNLNNFTSLNGKMMWPVDGKISSPFGKWRGKHKHEGIDIPMPAGTPIRAAKNGVVARTGNNSTMGFRGYGNFVMLDHGGGVRTFYAHCSSVAVQQGQRIMQGQIIGYVGSTGRSTANHLHFEVRINDAKVNPVPYLAGNTHLASHK